MATIVVYGGGFQPFHEGHLSSYLQAKKAFPGATFYVAASNDVKQRPIPFKDKQFLAQQAGVVDPFVETKNPINPQEILAQYDPEKDVYIMVRSERDPVGYTRKDGTPAYYQPYVKGQPMAPFSKHGYVFVTKKHNFTVDGQEVFSGSQVRSMYGSADDAGRMQIIQQLYPKSKQQQMIKSLLDKYLTSPQEPAAMPVKPNAINKLKNKALAEQIQKIRPLLKEASPAMKLKFMKLMKTALSENKETDYSDPAWDEKVASVGQKAKQAQALKAKGKEPQTRWNPVTKKYYVDFSDRDEKGVAEGWKGAALGGALGYHFGNHYAAMLGATLGHLVGEFVSKIGKSISKDNKLVNDNIDVINKVTSEIIKSSPTDKFGFPMFSANVGIGAYIGTVLQQEITTRIEDSLIEKYGKEIAYGIVKSNVMYQLSSEVGSKLYEYVVKLDKSYKNSTIDRKEPTFEQQGVAEGAPIVVAQAPIHIRNPKKAQPKQRYMGDIVPPTKPPSTEKRGVKGRPGQRPMPTYDEDVAESNISESTDYLEEK